MAAPRMGLRRIEADDGAITDPVPSQPANKSPMRHHQCIGPISVVGHDLAEFTASLIQRFLAFLHLGPPLFRDMIETQMGPVFLKSGAGRTDVAGERRAFADSGIDFEGESEFSGDDFRSLQGAPVRAANNPFYGRVGQRSGGMVGLTKAKRRQFRIANAGVAARFSVNDVKFRLTVAHEYQGFLRSSGLSSGRSSGSFG